MRRFPTGNRWQRRARRPVAWHNRCVRALELPPALAALASRHGVSPASTQGRGVDDFGTPQVQVRFQTTLTIGGHEVRVRIDGAVDAGAAHRRRPARYQARVAVAVPEAGTLALQVWPGDDPLDAWLRRRNRLGDPAFDRLYRVESSARALSPLWIDGNVRGALVAADDGTIDGPTLAIADGQVTVRAQLAGEATHVLDALVSAGVAVAEVPERRIASWRRATLDREPRLSGRWSPDGMFSLIWRERGVEVRGDVAFAAAADGGGRPWLRTRIRAAWDGPSFALVHGDLSRRCRPRVAAPLRRATSPPGWRLAVADRAHPPRLDAALIERAGAHAVIGDRGAVTAVVPGAELGDRWLAAGALVAALSSSARAPASPYR